MTLANLATGAGQRARCSCPSRGSCVRAELWGWRARWCSDYWTGLQGADRDRDPRTVAPSRKMSVPEGFSSEEISLMSLVANSSLSKKLQENMENWGCLLSSSGIWTAALPRLSGTGTTSPLVDTSTHRQRVGFSLTFRRVDSEP
jgi:hypothetical protein